jgi:predicted transcriptional regulator
MLDRELFRARRFNSRVTQTELSAPSGIRNDRISRFESGHVDLTADESARLLAALAAIERERSKAS